MSINFRFNILMAQKLNYVMYTIIMADKVGYRGSLILKNTRIVIFLKYIHNQTTGAPGGRTGNLSYWGCTGGWLTQGGPRRRQTPHHRTLGWTALCIDGLQC